MNFVVISMCCSIGKNVLNDSSLVQDRAPWSMHRHTHRHAHVRGSAVSLPSMILNIIGYCTTRPSNDSVAMSFAPRGRLANSQMTDLCRLKNSQ